MKRRKDINLSTLSLSYHGGVSYGIYKSYSVEFKTNSFSFSGDRGGNHEARVRRQGLCETPEEETAGTQPLREGEEPMPNFHHLFDISYAHFDIYYKEITKPD